MSLPTVPDINPHITLTREEVYHLLLASVAMEEIGLANILSAEGEKIRQVLVSEEGCLEALLMIGKSVDHILRSVMKNQLLLLCKLEDILGMDEDPGYDGNTE
ncbi:MAG: hypothetical protein C6W55_07460 [Thermobacillus sp.]|uniref:hypothetical protein n=1 Tax=Thermobacillus sp. TaxID=2108467 RepID=UPI000E3A39AC|nr:hypothetical protein [Thermobacillus sp.]REK56576.1 MAG: hypothetical protein C6W55_07460 [Thermobacillus sp.]